jgi:hypothetical protein
MATTTSFFQIYPDYYTSIEECEKFIKNYDKESSNLRYKNFKQTHFTAGDEEQFESYRHNKNSSNKEVNINVDNLFTGKKLFDEWEKFKDIDTVSILNTFRYIFYKFKKGIFIKIENNELKVFLPFSNINFVNEWFHNVKIHPKYKDIYEYFTHISELEGRQFNKKNVNKFANSWYSNNCLIRYEYPINEGDTNVSSIKNMLEELCKHRSVPDIEFFINRRDYPLLHRNEFEPYYHLWNSECKPLVSHNYSKYSPILSMSSNNNFADILMPTYEDWIRVQSKENKWFPKSRQVYDDDNFNIGWDEKKPIAIFRGSSTGEGVDIYKNQRLKLASIAALNELDDDDLPYLDAGITRWNFRPKKLIDSPYLQNIEIKHLNFDLVNKLTPLEQSSYKYIIHVDGHVSAFRLSYELSMNCVLLIVKSNWECWFSKFLEPYIHYVPIKDDLSDLITQIKWCKNNDDKCQIIAKNAKEFYNKFLKKDGILDYFQKLLIDVKKDIGTYYYNELDIFDIQRSNELKYFDKKVLKYPTTNKSINQLNLFPTYDRCYGLLKGIEYVINMINSKSNFSKKAIKMQNIFKNKLGIIDKYKLGGFEFIVKTTDNTIKIKEHIHEAFIGINIINNIVKDIPNFAYIFGLYKENNEINVISEFISNETLQSYIMGNMFNFYEFIIIFIQICLALEVVQNKYNFVHYDLTPWNIMLKYLNEPIKVDYIIRNKVISIKTRVIPVIIDYGKSYASYESIHYGFVKQCKFDKSFDILSLFITTIYQITKSQNLPQTDFDNLVIFSNFISNSTYCKNKFKNSRDIKTFFYSAKKYCNLIGENKFELENYGPLDLIEYIQKKLNYNIKLDYPSFYYSSMNKGEPTQVFHFSFEKDNMKKLNTFLITFYNIKNISLNNINTVFSIYLIQNLNIRLKSMYKQLMDFVLKENMKKEKQKVIYIYNYSIDMLKQLYKNLNKSSNINYADYVKYESLTQFNICYEDNIFLYPEKILDIIGHINKFETIYNYNIISNDLDLKHILNYILLYNDNDFVIAKKNKEYYNSVYLNLLKMDTTMALNIITNINSIKKIAPLVYKQNLEDKTINYDKKYSENLKEIINILK